jgi:predicted membrane protein
MFTQEIWTLKEFFCYPNEQIYWSLLIVMYPFMTGLVAGSFLFSSLYYLFNLQPLKDMSRFALVLCLALVVAAPLPLLLHLEQPARCFYVLLTPHFSSAMSVFGFVFSGFAMIVGAQLWLVYRRYFVEQSLYLGDKAAKSAAEQFAFFLNTILTLAAYDLSEKAVALDRRAIRFLSCLGIPAAFLLTGYVGFLFGSMKANPMWMSPLMPVIFILSGMLSGAALCFVAYRAALRLRALPWLASRKDEQVLAVVPDSDACQTLQMSARYILFTLVSAFTLEILDLVCRSYAAVRSWDILGELIYKRDFISIFVLQYGIGNLLPFLLLVLPRPTVGRTVISSLLILFGVFMMRWNVVIGGQSFSYTLAGFMDYLMPIVPKDLETLKNGPLAALAIFALPFVLLWILSAVFPLFSGRAEAAPAKGGAGES